MYPQRELTQLAVRKEALLGAIARRRAECTVTVARAARILAWLDRAVALGRRMSMLSLFAAEPLASLAGRTVVPYWRILGFLVRWGPLVAVGVRGLRSAWKKDAPAEDDASGMPQADAKHTPLAVQQNAPTATAIP